MAIKKNEKNYRIFRVEKATKKLFPKKITMTRIYADNDDDAYQQLKDYVKIANKEFTYYVERWSPHIVIRNGKKFIYDDISEAFRSEDNDKPIYKKIWNEISLICWKYFVRIPKDIYYCCRDLVYLIKHKHEYSDSWNIDRAMLEVLKFNIPILKKHKHCLSWAMLEKAYLEKHPELSKTEAKQYFKTHYEYNEEIEKRSVELEHEMLDKLIDDINTYEYYLEGYEDVNLFGDDADKEMLEIDKKLRHTLPLIKGSYDRYDYDKMHNLANKYWNKIWETVREYGQEFND